MSKIAKKKRSLSPRTSELVRERNGAMPVWIRPPVIGVEHYSGLSRAKLYQLAGEGKIRTVSLREPGQTKGCRLFHLQSILDYFEKRAQAAEREVAA